ncbi:MAG: flagellin [Paracoccus sp. (in: a-proteobacteria)]|uniref:flagellin N-terminal helical domain-containing protein n=1 Tax=Paracoccus sp. TaxID=267 RepID=UPI0026E0E30E|nr:flagellin [Paracoccus sp. (in: a-proteobacteria)]MDO5620880.1 flagellin [Paracoccus sp. (in: a-proteobacteria)]
MSSILTNNGAMVALQTLKGINSNLSKTQSEISTGKSVANAKDNAAIWAIAKTMENDVSGFKTIGSSLALGESTVSVARTAAESVATLLGKISDKIIAAQEGNIDREKMQTDIKALREQITSVVDSAQFNGLNLIDGTSTDDVTILSSLNRKADGTVEAAHITVGRIDLKVDGGLSDLEDLDVTDDHADALEKITGLIKTATDAAAAFGSAEQRITIQKDFVGKLADAMTSGIGSLVDADMEEASARLQALQVQQQLATQSLSIANQAPQQLLSLFR